MLNTQTPLIAEFLKDHQQFSRLLYEISKLLKENKIEKARERALELNDVAGPHIAYEEAELYTRLADLGEMKVTEDKLVDEHHEVLDSLKDLLDNDQPDAECLESIKAGFDKALSHAEHCGSLISLMSRLDDNQQTSSLAELIRFRAQGKKWTEL